MMVAAKIFADALRERIDAPFGTGILASLHAAQLAREFSGGVDGLLALLDDEADDPNECDRPYWLTLGHQLKANWTEQGDDTHLLVATGKTRAEWLALPVWSIVDEPALVA